MSILSKEKRENEDKGNDERNKARILVSWSWCFLCYLDQLHRSGRKYRKAEERGREQVKREKISDKGRENKGVRGKEDIKRQDNDEVEQENGKK